LPVAGERLKLARDTLCADCVSTKMLRGGMSVAAGAVSGQREDALDWRVGWGEYFVNFVLRPDKR
jgi:hypothetical protein